MESERDLSWLDVGDGIECLGWLALRRMTSIKFGLLDMSLVIFLKAISASGLMALTLAVLLNAIPASRLQMFSLLFLKTLTTMSSKGRRSQYQLLENNHSLSMNPKRL